MHNFVKVIEELIELFKQLIPLEEKKLEASKDNNIMVIEDCMVKEQAAILKIRGLEQEREKLQEAMGAAGLKFREILDRFPEEAEVLQPLFSELNTQIQVFQEINDGANAVLKTNIYNIEQVIHFKESGIYSGTGEAANAGQHFTNRKV